MESASENGALSGPAGPAQPRRPPAGHFGTAGHVSHVEHVATSATSKTALGDASGGAACGSTENGVQRESWALGFTPACNTCTDAQRALQL
jgi:hypothetical protein